MTSESGEMTNESAREISKWSDADLRDALRHQRSRGVHTWGVGDCGHYARGCRVCESCLLAEIARRCA